MWATLSKTLLSCRSLYSLTISRCSCTAASSYVSNSERIHPSNSNSLSSCSSIFSLVSPCTASALVKGIFQPSKQSWQGCKMSHFNVENMTKPNEVHRRFFNTCISDKSKHSNTLICLHKLPFLCLFYIKPTQ